MKQIGNLLMAVIRREGAAMTYADGIATVQVGEGPEREVLALRWDDDEEASRLIYELNHGRLRER